MSGFGTLCLGTGDVEKSGVEALDVVQYRLGAHISGVQILIPAGSGTT